MYLLARVNPLKCILEIEKHDIAKFHVKVWTELQGIKTNLKNKYSQKNADLRDRLNHAYHLEDENAYLRELKTIKSTFPSIEPIEELMAARKSLKALESTVTEGVDG